MTPRTMTETLARVLPSKGLKPRVQVMMRTTTGFVALQNRQSPLSSSFPLVEASGAAVLHTLSIWMNATLKYRYALFPKIKLKLKKKPIGKMAFM